MALWWKKAVAPPEAEHAPPGAKHALSGAENSVEMNNESYKNHHRD